MMKRVIFGSVLVLALVLMAGPFAQAADHAYVGAKKCKMCHKVQFTSWQGTSHAKATEVGKASKDRKFDASCLKCHATNGDEALAGVQCEACHGPGADYKKMSVMKDQGKSIANGLNIPSQETCNGCHTGDDHSHKVDFAKEINNKAAIHEFKNPPAK